MARKRLEDLKFDEGQVKEILAGASDREAKGGDITTYDELMADGMGAGIDEEYLRQEIEDYSKTKIVKIKTGKDGKLERSVQSIPKRMRWADGGASIGSFIGLIPAIITKDIFYIGTGFSLGITLGWLSGRLYDYVDDFKK
jgi:hypothetical protein